jgi:site-specific recombinase XerD
VRIHAGDSDGAELLAAFLEELRARHFSQSLLKSTRYAVSFFFAHLAGQDVDDLRAVREDHVRSFARTLQQRPTRRGSARSDNTVACYLLRLRAFFTYLERAGAVLHNPSLAVPLPKVQRRSPTVLSISAVRRLLAAPTLGSFVGLRDAAILELLYGTGVRAGECVRLDVQDVDLASGTLLVRNGKGRKDRHVPVQGRAKRMLARYLRQARPELMHDPRETALFLTRAGRRLGSVSLKHLVPRYARQVGLKVHAHALRHAFATHLLKGGASVRHVQQLLGHRFLETTAFYANVALTDLKQVLESSHPRARRKR